MTQEAVFKKAPRTKTNFNKKDVKVVDQRISTCSDCRRGIFKTQEHEWTSRGLVHKSCNNERQDETQVST